MKIDEQFIDEIVHRILKVKQAERIILFGSAASDKWTRDSDIDLVILCNSSRNDREERVRIGNALRDLGRSFDIIVMATDYFEESKNIIGGIAYPANKYGKVIYEAA